MESYRYRIFDPSGNVTALATELVYDPEVRLRVQDAILARHRDVEQVGFISDDASMPQLFMAGGEFCGNAVRAAAWHYLRRKPGEIKMRVLGVADDIRAGVSESLNVWAQVAVSKDPWNVKRIGEGLHFAELEGIAHLVVAQRQSREYLRGLDADSYGDKLRLKTSARELLKHFELYDRDACGVMFCENVMDMLKIHPCVFINSAGTAYYEMACGSGSVAVVMVAAALHGKSMSLPVLQPSERVIETTVEFRNGGAVEAVISGGVSDDDMLYELEV